MPCLLQTVPIHYTHAGTLGCDKVMQSTPYEANFTLHLLHAVLSFSRMRVVMPLAVCNQHKFRGQGQCTEKDQSVESYAEL